ncbi:OmpA family protein [Spirillospora sp. NPDC029432]|uniref:OmpA family protein n=1 Tax=Spirillospora sp. NPDC029432 TaxID=3154599 RepID=UPI0034512D05
MAHPAGWRNSPLGRLRHSGVGSRIALDGGLRMRGPVHVRPVLGAFAMTITLVIGAAACSGGDGKGGTGGKRGATASPTSGGAALGVRSLLSTKDARVELRSLERVAGKAVVARFRMLNDRPEGFNTINTEYAGNTEFGNPVPGLSGDSMSGISLLDGRNLRRYYPLHRSDQKCLCSPFSGGLDLDAKSGIDLFAVFPNPPKGVDRMDVLFPNAVPFLDVAIKDTASGSVQIGGETVDLAGVTPAKPVVVPVTSTVESRTQVEGDDGENLSVRLSADVLFALNKADLNAAAQDILRQVAGRIDRSPGTTVKVDGHTDNSGDDSINGPLSERRAEAVRAQLSKLVTKSGVTYQVKGHGSADPVESNETDEGRRKNRRVTITFQRPPEPAAAGAPAAAGEMEKNPRTVIGRAAVSPTRPPRVVEGDWLTKGEAVVHSLTRDSAGNATMVWSVRNDTPGSTYNPRNGLTLEPDAKRPGGVDGVRVAFDERVSRALYTSTGTLSPDYGENDQPKENGETLVSWGIFRIPADVKTVTVQIPGFQHVTNVPVG